MTTSRALLAWLLLAVLGFANGALRQLGYARFLADRTANQLSAVALVVEIAVAVFLLTRAWPLSSAGQAWRVGAVWLVLTFLFETGMGVAGGEPWSRILGAYALWEGQLWPLVVAFIFLSPRLALAAHAHAAGSRA